MRKLTAILFVFLFSFPVTGLAQIDSGFGIGPRLGYYVADDAEEGNFYGGLQIRGRLNPVFGLDGSVEYRGKQQYDFAGQTGEVSFVPVTGSALVYLPIDNFSPYGLAGLGAYYTIFESDGIFEDTDNEFNVGYHLGFGAEIPINNAALNIDYRYLFLNPDDNESNLEETKFSGNVFTIGLMFYF